MAITNIILITASDNVTAGVEYMGLNSKVFAVGKVILKIFTSKYVIPKLNIPCNIL